MKDIKRVNWKKRAKFIVENYLGEYEQELLLPNILLEPKNFNGFYYISRIFRHENITRTYDFHLYYDNLKKHIINEKMLYANDLLDLKDFEDEKR